MTALKKLPVPSSLRARRSGTRRIKPKKPPRPVTVELISLHPSISPDMDLTADWFPKPANAPPPCSFAQDRCVDDDIAMLQRDARNRKLWRVALVSAVFAFAVAFIQLSS